MVLPHGYPYPPSLHLPTSSGIQQSNSKPLSLPSYRVRARHGDFLALYPAVTECAGNE
jgi:hypothetical protein